MLGSRSWRPGARQLASSQPRIPNGAFSYHFAQPDQPVHCHTLHISPYLHLRLESLRSLSKNATSPPGSRQAHYRSWHVLLRHFSLSFWTDLQNFWSELQNRSKQWRFYHLSKTHQDSETPNGPQGSKSRMGSRQTTGHLDRTDEALASGGRGKVRLSKMGMATARNSHCSIWLNHSASELHKLQVGSSWIKSACRCRSSAHFARRRMRSILMESLPKAVSTVRQLMPGKWCSFSPLKILKHQIYAGVLDLIWFTLIHCMMWWCSFATQLETEKINMQNRHWHVDNWQCIFSYSGRSPATSMQQFPLESQIDLWLQATERGLFVARLQLVSIQLSVLLHIFLHMLGRTLLQIDRRPWCLLVSQIAIGTLDRNHFYWRLVSIKATLKIAMIAHPPGSTLQTGSDECHLC